MTDADVLICVAEVTMRQRGKLVTAEGLASEDIEVVALALTFDKQPPVLKLRALMEEWSRTRIVREIY